MTCASTCRRAAASCTTTPATPRSRSTCTKTAITSPGTRAPCTPGCSTSACACCSDLLPASANPRPRRDLPQSRLRHLLPGLHRDLLAAAAPPPEHLPVRRELLLLRVRPSVV